VDAIAGPVLATARGRVAAELIVGFSDGASLIDAGHDLGNYLFPVAQRLGPKWVAAIFGRKIHGPSSLAVGPAQPDTAGATPQFSARMAGSYERRQWKQELHDRLAVQAATIDPGPAGLKIALTTGPGRNWASLWKPLIDAFGPVLGEDPARPFHPLMTLGESAQFCSLKVPTWEDSPRRWFRCGWAPATLRVFEVRCVRGSPPGDVHTGGRCGSACVASERLVDLGDRPAYGPEPADGPGLSERGTSAG